MSDVIIIDGDDGCAPGPSRQRRRPRAPSDFAYVSLVSSDEEEAYEPPSRPKTKKRSKKQSQVDADANADSEQGVR